MVNYDIRVFKSFRTRALFAIPIGLLAAFTCGGWLLVVVPSARQPRYILALLLYWLACAAMVFCISFLIDESSRRNPKRR
jgi:hypothetical protein